MGYTIPAKLGYRMPAEWEKHEATWLAWPHNNSTWNNIDKIELAYIEIIKALHRGEKINILVNNDNAKVKIKKKLKKNNINIKKIIFYKIPTVDAWIRDYGPNFITHKNNNNSKIAFNHWGFNAWGNKYADLKQDTLIPEKINKFLKIKCFKPNIVLEGGSIDVNGKGICLTTEQCLLNKNRNPNLSKERVERYLMEYLGLNKIIWLRNGIKNDDTDGHVDDLARFVNHNMIACAYAGKNDENYEVLQENYEILENLRKNNKNLNIAKLPMPNIKFEGKLLPASYANFYIGNSAVLVPTFNHKNDKLALNTLRKLFPNKKIVGINCTELIKGFGAVHCITQQQPAV